MSNNNSRTWIGWQGIVAGVPQDWSLSAISGDDRNGYFRVDSPGTLALEVKWSSAGPKVDLSSKLDAYMDGLKRKARKSKINFEHKIKSKDGGVLSFTWRGDRKAQGKLWRCDECNRVLIAQVSGGPSDDISNLASLILPTILDHTEDDWRVWGMYDLLAETPPGYELEKHRLMSGYIRLDFRSKNNRLIIERWGLANIALKNITLRKWFDDRSRYDLRPYRCKIESVQFDEEAGIHVEGRRAGIGPLLKSAGEILSFRKPTSYIDGYVWACEKSNKIYSVQSIHSKDENVLDMVLERVICH